MLWAAGLMKLISAFGRALNLKDETPRRLPDGKEEVRDNLLDFGAGCLFGKES